MSRSDRGRRVVAHAAAFLAIARKTWRMQRREGWFWRVGVLGALTLVAPTVLNARALAGPDETQVTRFASVAGTHNYLAFTTIGIVAMAWIATLMQAVAIGLTSERRMGTLSTAWATLAPRTLILAADASGRALAQTTFGLVMFLTTWLLFRFELVVIPAALLLVAVASVLAGIAVGVLLAGFIIRYRDAGMLLGVFTVASGIFAGIAYPTTVLPDWAQWVGHALPLTWIARGFRGAVVLGDAPAAYIASAVLLGMALVLGAIGWQLFTHLERATRQRGLLEAF